MAEHEHAGIASEVDCWTHEVTVCLPLALVWGLSFF